MLIPLSKKVMKSKQCSACKKTVLLEEFRANKRNDQYTKLCIKCLDQAKISREKNKCKHGKQDLDVETSSVEVVQLFVRSTGSIRVHAETPSVEVVQRIVSMGKGGLNVETLSVAVGTVYCKHDIRKRRCRDLECGGGTAFCVHNIPKTICRDPECKGGGSFCKPHNK